MFHFPRFASCIATGFPTFLSGGFSHSDISGSKVAWHLPGAYRRHAASFIAFQSLGIHHTPLLVSVSLSRKGSLRTAMICCLFLFCCFYLRICTKLKRPNMGNFSVRCNLVVNEHDILSTKKPAFCGTFEHQLGASLSPPYGFGYIQHIDRASI